MSRVGESNTGYFEILTVDYIYTAVDLVVISYYDRSVHLACPYCWVLRKSGKFSDGGIFFMHEGSYSLYQCTYTHMWHDNRKRVCHTHRFVTLAIVGAVNAAVTLVAA
eukprot:SAG11_NODE_361_length_10183_cov_4.077053_3_plen_108_part_00